MIIYNTSTFQLMVLFQVYFEIISENNCFTKCSDQNVMGFYQCAPKGQKTFIYLHKYPCSSSPFGVTGCHFAVDLLLLEPEMREKSN